MVSLSCNTLQVYYVGLCGGGGEGGEAGKRSNDLTSSISFVYSLGASKFSSDVVIQDCYSIFIVASSNMAPLLPNCGNDLYH